MSRPSGHEAEALRIAEGLLGRRPHRLEAFWPTVGGDDSHGFRAAYGTDHDPQDDLGRFYLLAILVFEKLLFYDPAALRGRWAITTLKGNLRVIGGGR